MNADDDIVPCTTRRLPMSLAPEANSAFICAATAARSNLAPVEA